MISYILFNSTEPDVRLADALLFRSLSNHLGDMLGTIDHMRNPTRGEILWGPNPMGIFRTSHRERQSFLNASARASMGDAVILEQSDIPAHMDAMSAKGKGVILRNMKDPVRRLRYTQPGDTYDQHSSAIGAKNHPVKVMVQENKDLVAYRRFFVVAGSIVTETPLTFKGGGRTVLSEWQSHRLQAKSLFDDLEHHVPLLREIQYERAVTALDGFDLACGYIDVGMTDMDPVSAKAEVETVASTAPGAADMFFADPEVYAKAVAENLHIIEPDLHRSEAEETVAPDR